MEDAGGNTASSLSIRVKSNATDLSDGFVLQWMEYDQYVADQYSWANAYYAIFAADSPQSPYSLPPGSSVEITVGAALAVTATETNGAKELACGKKFALRVFPFGTDLSTVGEDDGNFWSSWTSDCFTGKGCTYTIGYWQTHGPIPRGNTRNKWPLSSVVLGNRSYTDLQALVILQTAPRGNGLIILARQLIGAKLNVAAGAGTDAVLALIAQADTMIGDLVVGVDSLPSSQTSSLAAQLDAYNNGLSGVAHCG